MRGLRLEEFDRPAVSGAGVELALVHAVLFTEPELDRLRRDPVTTPMGGSRNFVTLEPLFDLLELPDQVLLRVDLAGLVGLPRSETMSDRTRLKVGV